MSAPRLEYRRRKLILRGGGQPTAGQNEWQVAVPSRSVALQLGLYMLCLFGLALWRAIELRSTPGIVIELLLYGGIAALLGCVLCIALSQRQGESQRWFPSTLTGRITSRKTSRAARLNSRIGKPDL